MREYKFRAKIATSSKRLGITAGEWFTWTLEEMLNGDRGYLRHIDRETIGRYTGLKDKNGKEIYEGDILNVQMHYDSYGRKNHDYRQNCPISWDEKYACFQVDGSRKTTKDAIEDCVIVGNIYENPDLLK